jgi:hypothetical protein
MVSPSVESSFETEAADDVLPTVTSADPICMATNPESNDMVNDTSLFVTGEKVQRIDPWKVVSD